MKEEKNYSLPCLSAWEYVPDQKEAAEFRTNNGFSLQKELLTSFKPDLSTRYFVCQLWNITNTCQMFNNPALLCLSLSNNTFLGAWFREAIVRRMRIGGKVAWQEGKKWLLGKFQNFCVLYLSPDIPLSLPGRWNQQERVLSKHCLNEEMLNFPSSVVAAQCWGS